MPLIEKFSGDKDKLKGFLIYIKINIYKTSGLYKTILVK